MALIKLPDECAGSLKARAALLIAAVFVCALYDGNARAQAILPTALYKVGMTQVEFTDPAEGGRPLNFILIYPAVPDNAAKPFHIFMSTGLHLYKDAPLVADDLRHPLIVFSHGA